MGNGWTGLLSDPRGDIDRLREINDPLGFGGGPTGESAQDVYNTLLALGISPEAAEELIRNDLLRQLLPEERGPGGSSASVALGYAQLAETQRQNAYERVSDRIRLLAATDDLQEARRENAMSALLQAAPLLVAPGTEYSPGFEPGGPAMQLSNLIGANMQPQRLVTAPLPLSDYLNAPTTVTPDSINRDTAALMGG